MYQITNNERSRNCAFTNLKKLKSFTVRYAESINDRINIVMSKKIRVKYSDVLFICINYTYFFLLNSVCNSKRFNMAGRVK